MTTDGIAAGIFEPCRDGGLMPEIARERDRADAEIVARGLFEERESAIGAAIVHENDFVRAAGELVEDGASSAQEFRENGLFIVKRNRKGETERRVDIVALPSSGSPAPCSGSQPTSPISVLSLHKTIRQPPLPGQLADRRGGG